jgi:purine-binding chemotaxis protein CheW
MEHTNKADLFRRMEDNAENNQWAPSLEELMTHIDGEVGFPLKDPLPGPPDENKSDFKDYVTHQHIQFMLDNRLFSLPLENALEIGRIPNITPLPNLPEWILGVSNIRGEIISMVDLNLFFAISQKKPTGDPRFIIATNQKIKVGLIVDRIMGTINTGEANINLQEAPHRNGQVFKYVKGVIPKNENLIHVLDVDTLLSSSRMNEFNY